MAEVTGDEENQFVNEILDRINLSSELKNLKTTITQSVSYRRALCIIDPVASSSASNELTQKIEFGNTTNFYDRTQYSNVINFGFAMIAERYDIFGQVSHYPKQLLVGPEAMERSVIFSPEQKKFSPNVRDIDRLMWVKITSTKDVGLIYMDLLNDWVSQPATVNCKIASIYFSTSGDKSLDEKEIALDVSHIFKDLLFDGDQFDVSLASIRHHTVKSETASHALLVYYASLLAIERRGFESFARLGSDDVRLFEERMIKSIVIGNLGYNTPSDPEQKNRPVPIGAITTQRLLSVFTNVVVKQPSESFTRFKIDSKMQKNRMDPLRDRRTEITSHPKVQNPERSRPRGYGSRSRNPDEKGVKTRIDE
jgi:hypothetical protein